MQKAARRMMETTLQDSQVNAAERHFSQGEVKTSTRITRHSLSSMDVSHTYLTSRLGSCDRNRNKKRTQHS